MISIIMTVLLIILFLFTGRIIDGLKKLVKLIASNLLKLLNFFGIKINRREKNVDVSKEFRQIYKEIKVVKLSKKNLKEISSIDWTWFIVLIISGLLILFNMKFMFGSNIISDWLYTMIKNLNFIKSSADMNTLYTATLFSVLSFSTSKLLQRWKETKQQRVENKEAKIKKYALQLMDSKELVEEAIKKDKENLEHIKNKGE